MALPVITVGKDVTLPVALTDTQLVSGLFVAGQTDNFSTATINAALLDMNGNVLIPLTAQSNTVGNWATGQILVQFSAAATAGLSSGNAILQIDVILNTKTSTPPFMQVIIQAGA